MQKDKGFVAIVVLFVLALFTMSLVRCDVRHATAPNRLIPATPGGQP